MNANARGRLLARFFLPKSQLINQYLVPALCARTSRDFIKIRVVYPKIAQKEALCARAVTDFSKIWELWGNYYTKGCFENNVGSDKC